MSQRATACHRVPAREASRGCCFAAPLQGQRPEGVLMPSAAAQVPAEVAQRAQQGAADAAAGEQAGNDGGRPDQEPYLVPACAAWFRWDGIADVEEAHFKDFLAADPAANPERYREYRNAIINKYRWGVADRRAGLGRRASADVDLNGGWAWWRMARPAVLALPCTQSTWGPASPPAHPVPNYLL